MHCAAVVLHAGYGTGGASLLRCTSSTRAREALASSGAPLVPVMQLHRRSAAAMAVYKYSWLRYTSRLVPYVLLYYMQY